MSRSIRLLLAFGLVAITVACAPAAEPVAVPEVATPVDEPMSKY